jgi:hypothetical protein
MQRGFEANSAPQSLCLEERYKNQFKILHSAFLALFHSKVTYSAIYPIVVDTVSETIRPVSAS